MVIYINQVVLWIDLIVDLSRNLILVIILYHNIIILFFLLFLFSFLPEQLQSFLEFRLIFIASVAKFFFKSRGIHFTWEPYVVYLFHIFKLFSLLFFFFFSFLLHQFFQLPTLLFSRFLSLLQFFRGWLSLWNPWSLYYMIFIIHVNILILLVQSVWAGFVNIFLFLILTYIHNYVFTFFIVYLLILIIFDLFFKLLNFVNPFPYLQPVLILI